MRIETVSGAQFSYRWVFIDTVDGRNNRRFYIIHRFPSSQISRLLLEKVDGRRDFKIEPASSRNCVYIYSNIEIWGAGFPRLCLPRVRFFRPSTEWQKLYLYLRTLKFWVRGSRSKTRKYFSFVDPVNWASYYDDKTFSFISPRGGVLLGSSIRSRELLQAWIGRQGRLSTIENKFRPR